MISRWMIADTTMVVFEVKLFSPFGSYHHPARPDAAPYHQLAVQYAATKAWAAGLQLREPIMVAVTADSRMIAGQFASISLLACLARTRMTRKKPQRLTDPRFVMLIKKKPADSQKV